MTTPIYAGVSKADYSIADGTYVARLIQIIQIGSQYFCKKDSNGEVKSEWYSAQILVGFEIPSLTYENQDGVKLTTIKSTTYFLSMNPSRNGVPGLREIIDGMRGSAEYTEEELEKFDISAFLGKLCSITLSGVESKGKVYQNITEVAPIPADFKLVIDEEIIQRKTILVTVDNFKDIDNIDLPEWIINKIKLSSEFAKLSVERVEDNFLPSDEIKVDDIDFTV